METSIFEGIRFVGGTRCDQEGLVLGTKLCRESGTRRANPGGGWEAGSQEENQQLIYGLFMAYLWHISGIFMAYQGGLIIMVKFFYR